jgi:RNA polymerase sigma-70 factor (ECF subfamily)
MTRRDALRPSPFALRPSTSVDAEDAVQEAYLRWHRRDEADVRDPLAWLVTVVTRVSIDRLRALSAERKHYVGPWLPEPLVASDAGDPARHAELAADLSVAYLLVLERLAPEERAAFLLHEAFGYAHAEIARVLGKTEAATRQLVHRAQERVQRERPRFLVDRDAARKVVQRFLHALEERDVDALLRVLAEDVSHAADGGGRRGAARNVVHGRDRVSRLLLGVQQKFWGHLIARLVDVNGAPGFLLERDGTVHATVALDTDGERVRAIYVVVNPAKLPSGRN